MAGTRLAQIFRSGLVTSAGLSVIGTGSYVLYKDKSRFPRIEEAFARGSLLPPLADNQYEVTYFRREDLEPSIRKMLSPTFSNEYYLVSGQVGCGKTRIVLETVRQLMSDQGARNEGAPVYVLATQGKSFAESLAAATSFQFDEHIRFKFFIDSILKIKKMPSHDEHNKLMRVLDAIEVAGFRYMEKWGRPAVIVIDGADFIAKHLPEGMARMQEKAKLWADTNIVKLVFISNGEYVEEVFQQNQSVWARADSTFYVGDLAYEDAVRFLQRKQFYERGVRERSQGVLHNPMTRAEAEAIVDLVGGRIQHLLQFRRDWEEGVPYEFTAERLKAKERQKLSRILKRASAVKALAELLRPCPTPDLHFSGKTSEEDVDFLTKRDILATQRTGKGLCVRFQSVLTEHVAREALNNLIK